MELINVLATNIQVYGQTFDVSLNWIGKIIRWICGSVGVVGIGVILFSLVLKLLTLPLDVYQRIAMRKQNLQMKANQEKMEKLQKQYANDKAMYNQKVMEMYRENGISLFSSCLPMILSLVIFIVAINAFNAYAQYSNVENYNTLVDAYSANMKKYTVELNEENYPNLVNQTGEDENVYVYTVASSQTGKFVYYTASLPKEKVQEITTTAEMVALLTDVTTKKDYFVDEVRAVAEDSDIAKYVSERTEISQGEAVKNYLVNAAQDAVVVEYNTTVKKNTSFGWIKNVWVVDAAYEHPVLSAKKFEQEAKQEKFKVEDKKVKYGKMTEYTNIYTADVYNNVTAKLDHQKGQANGYFILIALSIGTILLQQFVMMRSQKEQQKYSSVDGSAGSQQKMTMIIMTGMFAIFSFMYSSAFSIYMITSNLFSMGSTLVINKFVDKSMEKKEAKAVEQKYKNHTAERIEKARNAGKAAANNTKKNKK